MSKFWITCLLLIPIISGCSEPTTTFTNEIESAWVDASTEWGDAQGSQLSYVDSGTSIHLDLGWYTNPSDNNTWTMGYIDEFTYENGTLTGTYSSFQNSDSDELFSITLTFSYASGTLTVVCNAGGVLGQKTLTLTSAT
ncbi:MAG: hypothetical protein WC136_11770 [Sphaerochaeta sp.]